MRISCDQAEKLMIDYLDGTLSAKEHKNIEEHISACATCKQNSQLQRAWLEETAPLLTADPARVPAIDLSEKIKAAVQAAAQEADTRMIDVPAPIAVYRRPFWQKLVATAAAVVILAVSVQVFIGLYNATFNRTGDRAGPGQEMTMAGADTDTGIQSIDNGDDYAVDGEGNIINESGDLPADRTADETTKLIAAENWQIFTGSLAELPVGRSLFIEPEEDESEKTTEATEDAEDPELTEKVPIDPDDPDSGPVKPLQPMIDLLCQASAVRVLTREGPPAEIMIMAFWPKDVVDDYYKILSEKSVSWPYTVYLAKVSAAEEQLRLRIELGAELAELIFDDIDFEQWVMVKIRIGE